MANEVTTRRLTEADADRLAREALGKCEDPSSCAYCGKPSEGNFSIHRDGFGVGPEVPLCDLCGGYPSPTLPQIWARIARSS